MVIQRMPATDLCRQDYSFAINHLKPSSIVSQANFGGPGAICINLAFVQCLFRPYNVTRLSCLQRLAKRRSNEISLCSAGQNASIDMHIDILQFFHLNFRSCDLRSQKVTS